MHGYGFSLRKYVIMVSGNETAQKRFGCDCTNGDPFGNCTLFRE